MRDITVATFNAWGFGEPWRYTVERGQVRGAAPGSPATMMRPPGGVWPRRRQLIERALAAVEPEVIGLQEIKRHPDSSGGGSQVQQLASDLGYSFVFLPISELAFLTRNPIREWREVPLPLVGQDEPTGGASSALHGKIESTVGSLDLIVAHLTPRSEAQQLATARFLRDYVAGLPSDRTPILVGDLNARPESETVRALTAPGDPGQSGGPTGLRDAWAEVHGDDDGATMPSHRPLSPTDRPARIDYVLVGPGPKIVRAVLLGTVPDADGFFASDHLGVAATLRWE
jgi:endonuclease/exonuclease/phosphatase family metal-dependent hydrolase